MQQLLTPEKHKATDVEGSSITGEKVPHFGNEGDRQGEPCYKDIPFHNQVKGQKANDACFILFCFFFFLQHKAKVNNLAPQALPMSCLLCC